jgi:hypothetical protein
MNAAKNAVTFGTIYFIAFIITLYVPPLFGVAPWLFIGSPFIMIWMILDVLKDGRQKFPELGKHE